MPKDEFFSNEERTIAAISYIPIVWLIFLLWPKWWRNYFTRYHIAHAALLSLVNLVFLTSIGFSTLWVSNWSGYSFLLIAVTGSLMALSLIISAGFVLYCATSAFQGRYIVLPGITRFFYLSFGQRLAHQNTEKKERKITHFQPYINQKQKRPYQ